MKFYVEVTSYEQPNNQPVFEGECDLQHTLTLMANYGSKAKWDTFLTIALGYSEDFNYLEDLVEFVFNDTDPFTIYIEEIRQ